MTIYIAKNDQKLGPYSIDEAQSLVSAGTIDATDWAWYEGLTDWIPLNQVPGFDAADAAPAPAVPLEPADAAEEPAPRAKRPVMVWVISLYYFFCIPFGLLSLALIPFMLSGAIPISEAQRHYFESLTYVDHGATLIISLCSLTGAVLLFRLKRSALYFFIGGFAVNLMLLVYSIVAKNYIGAMGIPSFIGLLIGYGIIIAIILYVWHLFKKGVLR